MSMSGLDISMPNGGQRDVTVTTGSEVAVGPRLFDVTCE
jgi:hypothetical protein